MLAGVLQIQLITLFERLIQLAESLVQLSFYLIISQFKPIVISPSEVMKSVNAFVEVKGEKESHT